MNIEGERFSAPFNVPHRVFIEWKPTSNGCIIRVSKGFGVAFNKNFVMSSHMDMHS